VASQPQLVVGLVVVACCIEVHMSLHIEQGMPACMKVRYNWSDSRLHKGQRNHHKEEAMTQPQWERRT